MHQTPRTVEWQHAATSVVFVVTPTQFAQATRLRSGLQRWPRQKTQEGSKAPSIAEFQIPS